MSFILTSLLRTYEKDAEGNKHAIPLVNDNHIVENIKKLLPKTDKFVLVANEPSLFEEHEAKLQIMKDSFAMADLHFKQNIILNNKNKKIAKQVLDNADLVVLGGGKIICQRDFFEEMNMGKLLKNHKGLIIGVSAGAMNLCKDVANFPEENSDLNDDRWTKGLGFFNEIIIPHFDGENIKYQFDCGDFDVAKDYILPMSKGKEFVAMPNSSYILIDNDNNISYHGDIYKIKDGNVEKFVYENIK